MREIHAELVSKTVAKLFMEANTRLGQDVLSALGRAETEEESPLAKEVLRELQQNARIAEEEQVPMCQDTGLAVVFAELGQEVHIVGGYLYDAINEGVRRGYAEGYLRKSACHPFTRVNTGDNTPAVIHLDLLPGDRLRLIAVPKGGGSENMSRVTMLTPAAGREGIIDFVVERVRESSSNPCPPIVVGVGIGGTFERAALLAKKALIRPLGSANPEGELAALEAELLGKINDLGIGPQGYGGRITALGVHVETTACHIASLPVAVNIQCHASRHAEAML